MLGMLLAADVRALIQDFLVFGLAVAALYWGSTPERAAIAIWFFCIEVPNHIYLRWLHNEVSLSDVDLFMASSDLVAGILWVALALYANRNYTLFIAGVQLLAIGSHVSRGLVESVSPIAYALLVVAPGWMILAIMAVGFVRHARRKGVYGSYRDWRVVRRSDDNPTLKIGSIA